MLSMGILELCLEKCIIVAVIIAGFVGWIFLVCHVPTLVDVEQYCGEVIFSFPFLLGIFFIFLSCFLLNVFSVVFKGFQNYDQV